MSDPTSPPAPEPKSKGGRPKGSKSRPKWLLNELKKVPKKPRGRPKGSRNRPKTVIELLQRLQEPPPPKPPGEEKPKRRRERQGYHGKPREAYFSKLKREDPEKLREISTRAINSEARKAKPRAIAGVPSNHTLHEWAIRKEAARTIAHRIFAMLDKEGALPENPIARQAMKQALEMLAEDNSTKDRLAIVRTLLEYNLAKPASTQNVNLKTAEDFLDDLANEDTSDE